MIIIFNDCFHNFEQHPIAKQHKEIIINSPESLQRVVNVLRQERKKIAWTNGVFDMLHVGHMLFLQHASQQADVLIVGINSDLSIKTHKPVKSNIPRPLLNETIRASSVASIKGVDYVFVFDNPTTEEYLHIIKPDFWLRTDSYKKDYGMAMEEHPEGKIVLQYGGICKMLPMAGGISTTEFASRMAKVYLK